jgi:hypothetical protein
MSKKVLALYYSQSGQLEEIINQFTAPLAQAGASVERVQVKPLTEYPFPWTGGSFFAVMPDSVLGKGTALVPFHFQHASYDLIILGYQPWFLSPSIPANSILVDQAFRQLAKDTPVVTITGARNMWLSAMESMKVSLRQMGARLVGNIALVDNHPNLISFVTIFHWMFSGKKDRYLNLFPKPGVSDDQIVYTRVYGEIVQKYLDHGHWENLQRELVQHQAVVVKYNLMFIETKAKRIFKLWAGFISKRKKRTAWLVVFKYYLLIALFIAAPIILTIDAVLFKPFLAGRIRKQKQYYSDVN